MNNINNWLSKTSSYYVFHFLAGSIAAKEIKTIISSQEKWYSLITKKLNIKNKHKIHYYLYSSRNLKEKLTGNSGNAHTQWNDFSVHTIYSKNLKILGPHEDTHLITLKWGISIGLLREGLAEYLHPLWHKETHKFWMKKFTQQKKFDLEKLFDNDYFYSLNPNISYPIAGSFVKYLIKKYGLIKFKKTYSKLSKENHNQENIILFEKIYKKSIKEILTDWIKY